MTRGAARTGGVGALLLAALLALGGCAATETCTLHPVATLPMMPGVPLPLVAVQVNGRDATMVLDTGAAGVLFTPSGAAVLGLRADPKRTATATGVGGSVTAMGVTLERISFGPSVIRNVPAEVLGQNLPRVGDVAIDGALGMPVIDHYDLDLDMRARQATLYAGEACRKSPPDWPGMQRIRARSLEGLFVIPVRVDGHAFTALVDSGSQENVLFTDARGIAFARAHQLPGHALHGVGPRLAHAFMARFDRLEVGDETMRGVAMVVTERHTGTPDVILGQPFLARHHVWFSAQRGTLFIAPEPG